MTSDEIPRSRPRKSVIVTRVLVSWWRTNSKTTHEPAAHHDCFTSIGKPLNERARDENQITDDDRPLATKDLRRGQLHRCAKERTPLEERDEVCADAVPLRW